MWSEVTFLISYVELECFYLLNELNLDRNMTIASLVCLQHGFVD